MRRKAFTLVELLVVLGIIALLVGILLPSLSQVRKRANSVRCKASLHDIGAQFSMYLNDSKGKLPRVNPLPTQIPVSLDGFPIVTAARWIGATDVRTGLPYPQQGVLDSYGSNKQVYRCVADLITTPAPDCDIGFDNFFQREGSSYMYAPNLAAVGYDRIRNAARTLPQVAAQLFADDHPGETGSIPLSVIMVLWDFDNFHNSAGASGARNYLFADTHVSDDIN